MYNEFEEFCKANDIYISFTGSLTTKVRGFCYYIDGKYIVTINNKLCFNGQQKTVIHELIHIFENHFTCLQEDMDTCEKQVKVILNNLNYLENQFQCEY